MFGLPLERQPTALELPGNVVGHTLNIAISVRLGQGCTGCIRGVQGREQSRSQQALPSEFVSALPVSFLMLSQQLPANRCRHACQGDAVGLFKPGGIVMTHTFSGEVAILLRLNVVCPEKTLSHPGRLVIGLLSYFKQAARLTIALIAEGTAKPRS